MPRTHGYSPKGQRCYDTHDWGAKGRINAIGALIGKVLITVSLFTGSINTPVFNSWVRQDLLSKVPPNSVIVMDNATFHKSVELRKMIEEAGHALEYLPPYSPDLNPIERKWAQYKKKRRQLRCGIEELFANLDD